MTEAVILTNQEFTTLLTRIDYLEAEVKSMKNQPLVLTWISRKQACEMLGIKTAAVITTMINRGELVGRKEIKKVEVTLESVRAYKCKYQISQ